MLPAVTLLLVYQTIGEILAHALNLPVPRPVIGMLMLLLTLAVRLNGALTALQVPVALRLVSRL